MKNILLLFMVVSMLVPAIGRSQATKAIKGKELFGDMTARHNGPALMSGRVNDLEVHPTNSRIVYTTCYLTCVITIKCIG